MAIYNKVGEGVVNQLSIDTADVLIDPYTNNPIYQFEPKYLLDSNLSKVASGISVVKNIDNEFIFNIKNRLNITLDERSMKDDAFFNGVKVDVLNKSGLTVLNNFTSGDVDSLVFTESENIGVFGSFNKDYGIRMTIDDKTNVLDHVSEYYLYGNPLYIKNIKASDYTGVFFNHDPIGYQTYKPCVLDLTDPAVLIGELNAAYSPKTLMTLNNKNVSLDMKVVFASGLKEKLKIKWGDGQEDVVFYYNGNTFVGPGVTVTNTNTGDINFLSINESIEINGKTYEFIKNHTYTVTNPTGFLISVEIAESNASDYVEALSGEAFLPNALTPTTGIRLSSEGISGSVDFEFEFYNDQNYTSFNKLDVYTSLSSGTPTLSNENLLLTENVFSLNEKNKYQMSLTDENIEPFIPYWFTFVPYSDLGSGYAWTIGPYAISQEIDETRIAADVGELRMMGERSYELNEILEGIIPGESITLIDELPTGSGILSCEYYVSAFNQKRDTCSLKLILNNNTESQNQSRKSLHLSQHSVSDNCFVGFLALKSGDILGLVAKTTDFFGENPADSNVFYTIKRSVLVYDLEALNVIGFP